MAHGGHDCGLGADPGLGVATEAACEPVVVPGVRSGLLFAVESLSERTQQHSPTNNSRGDSRQGTGRVAKCSREGAAGGFGKSGHSEAGPATGFEIGGRSAIAESCGGSDDAICAAFGNGTHEFPGGRSYCGSGSSSARRECTKKRIARIATGGGCRAAGGC